MRISIFTSNVQDLRLKSWSQLFGLDPEAENTQIQIGQKTVSGPLPDIATCMAVIITQPSRADLIFTTSQAEDKNTEISHIGDIDSVWGKIFAYFEKWIDGSAKIDRVAFGCTLLQQTGSDGESIERLAYFLPNLNISKETTDLIFRINRPIKSRICDVRINRLVVWQAVRYGNILIDVGSGRALPSAARERCAAQCILDINTVPNGVEVYAQDAARLVAELATVATKLAREGDVL